MEIRPQVLRKQDIDKWLLLLKIGPQPMKQLANLHFSGKRAREPYVPGPLRGRPKLLHATLLSLHFRIFRSSRAITWVQ